MTSKKQIGVSLALVLATAAVVTVQLRGNEEQDAAEGAGGHDHAAMAAGGGEMKPVRLDAEGSRRIGVTFATVERRTLTPSLTTLGTVEYDETRLATVNPKIDGWVEVLHADFTGAPIRKGEPLMEVYSPKLVSAQEELILARRLVDGMADEAGRALENAQVLMESARRRLAYWDIPEQEIRRIEESGEVLKTLTLHSPASGILVEKNVVEGDRIMPGMTVFRIADLSTVWIETEVFEKDLALVKEHQAGEARFEAYPGRTFPGHVTYVYPTVSVETRTGKIRLELANPGLLLRPGMYADVRLQVGGSESSLVAPRSAVLATGERVVVFVREADGTLVPREVTRGRSVGREVEILAGLMEGDRVVSSAGFLIDAESNLGSAMGEDEQDAPTEDHSGHDMSAMEGGAMEGDTMAAEPATDPSSHEGHQMDSAADSMTMSADTTGHSGHGN